MYLQECVLLFLCFTSSDENVGHSSLISQVDSQSSETWFKALISAFDIQANESAHCGSFQWSEELHCKWISESTKAFVASWSVME